MSGMRIKIALLNDKEDGLFMLLPFYPLTILKRVNATAIEIFNSTYMATCKYNTS